MKKIITLIISLVFISPMVIAESIDDLKSFVNKAILYGDLEAANKYIEEVAALDSADVDLLGFRCMAFLMAETGSDDSVFVLIDKAIKARPQELRYRLDELRFRSFFGEIDSLCQAYSVVGGADNNRQWITRSGDVLSTDSVKSAVDEAITDVFFNLGASRDYSVADAEKFADHVRSIETDSIRQSLVEFSLGNIYLNEKEYDKALAKFQSLLGRKGIGDGSVYYNMADVYRNSGDRDKAMEYARKAAESDDEYTREQANAMIEYLETPEIELSYSAFQFQLLPAMLKHITPGSEYEVWLIDPSLFVNRCKTMSYNFDRDLLELSSTVVNVDSTEVIVWKMLPPKDITDCLYIAFVPKDDAYRMITLEKTFALDEKTAGKYLLCEAWWNNNDTPAHTNYGTMIDGSCSPADFARIAYGVVYGDEPAGARIVVEPTE